MAIVNGHVFNDGNKRTGLVTMLAFLEMNGYEIRATQEQRADWMVALAMHQLDQRSLSVLLMGSIREIE